MSNLIKLNTARNCLRHLIRIYEISEIYIPYYICNTVKYAIRKENCKIIFYHIDDNFFPKTEFPKDSYILYPNYFGICDKNIQILKKKYSKLIIDNAHAFYQPHCSFASFYSLRKFFQNSYLINDGAYLYCDKFVDFNYETAKDCSIDAKNNYEFIVKNELRLDNEEIMKISNITQKIANAVDYEEEKQKRIQKFYYYHSIYKKNNELNLNLTENDVPFVYPFLSKNVNIVGDLEKQGLLIFRYWQGIPKNFEEHYFYKYLVPIPIY